MYICFPNKMAKTIAVGIKLLSRFSVTSLAKLELASANPCK
jgi:hypothetical protein